MKKYVAIAPEGEYLEITPGKEYPIIEFDMDCGEEKIWGKYGRGFYIFSDDGNECACLELGCSHLNGGNWIIKEVKK